MSYVIEVADAETEELRRVLDADSIEGVRALIEAEIQEHGPAIDFLVETAKREHIGVVYHDGVGIWELPMF